MRRGISMTAVVLALTACAGGGVEPAAPMQIELPSIDSAGFEDLVEASDRPLVVNFWASWCIPCRSEAPLLAAAHLSNTDVRFVGIASDDTRSGAADFIVEFGIAFDNYFDAAGEVKGSLGGSGLPMTVFVAPGGEIVVRHFGVIDDRALALGIDELMRR